MIISSLMFYVFAITGVAAAAGVVLARNPVHSVLFLILAFFNAAGLFLLLGAEFLAMVLVIVYVGAVAVLFLFVVMMLDINFLHLREGMAKYWPIGLVVGIVVFAELVMAFTSSIITADEVAVKAQPIPDVAVTSNTEAIGMIIYTDYIYLFQGAGLVLLVAMVGAIMLTLRQREGVKKQNISAQIARRKEDTLEIKKVPSGGGA